MPMQLYAVRGSKYNHDACKERGWGWRGWGCWGWSTQLRARPVRTCPTTTQQKTRRAGAPPPPHPCPDTRPRTHLSGRGQLALLSGLLPLKRGRGSNGGRGRRHRCTRRVPHTRVQGNSNKVTGSAQHGTTQHWAAAERHPSPCLVQHTAHRNLADSGARHPLCARPPPPTPATRTFGWRGG